MTLAGAPLQGYSTGDPAPAGPSSEWAAPQQGSPGRHRCFRIDFPGPRSALALPAKLNQRRLTISVPHEPKRQPWAISCVWLFQAVRENESEESRKWKKEK
ncbi:hypothetical protein NDU88_005478 [Pleurodeles waltl]|uniref:Uncharacterized protein n=1 Tax=Pleurodeles waltl TaxID=8319 RepID=A0AAV7PI76_PLEWA|nr:hypothetical protein NDU88_005478 [Pleurodeles waltl]